MVRVIIGAIPAAIAMFILGFIFYATPLARLGTGSLEDQQAAAVQQTLAANIAGTGTYSVPDVHSQAQTNMYSQGPIATIHYNAHGFAATETTSLVGGLVFDFIIALLIGAALIGIDRRVPDFGSRARVVAILAVAATAYTRLGEPLFWHHDWSHAIYVFIADSIVLAAGGLIIARWFLPRHAHTAAPADAPTAV